ncbi:MAG: biopolymer transporter ExbD [Deltaproteobacteria bacterium]|nr:biopolymer transporter ExbD [Deltaproteobacteria bacterium]
MGMNVGGKGAQSDINVTPLVDIVLVLLIIFMVITPMLTKNLPIEVPQKAEIDEPPDESKDQLFIKLFDDGHVELNKTEVSLEELKTKLADKLSGRSPKDRVVFFDGEDNAAYGNAVAVMDIAKGAGADTIGMVTPREADPLIPTGLDAPEGAAPEAPAPEAPE